MVEELRDKSGEYLKKEKHKEHKHIYFFTAIIIVLALILALLVRPALLASKFSKQFDELGMSPSDYLTTLESVKSKLAIAENNLASCQNLKEELVYGIAAEKNSTMRCMQDKALTETRIAQLKNEYELNLTAVQDSLTANIKAAQSELDTQNLKYVELNQTYYAIIQNSANNICCKAKVDNPLVDSYVVLDNKITCTSGRENKIAC